MGLWDSVTGFFSDLGDFFSGKDFFEAAGYAWNDMMKLAADVLTKNPSSGTYKDVWENISTIYTTLNVVAVSLLCIFFLYGFCRDSCDLHADLTFERTIKMFIRLIITSNVMSMALSYMPKFFAWGKNLTSAILGENKLSMIYDFDGAKVYENISSAGFGTMIAFLTSILFFLFTVVCGLWIYRGADGVKSYSEDLHDRSVCRCGIVYPCSRRSDGKCGLFLYTHFFRICVFCVSYCGCDYDQCQFYQYRCNRHG